MVISRTILMGERWRSDLSVRCVQASEMQLRGIALHTNVMDAARKSGLDVLDADEIHDRRLWISVRNDQPARKRFSGLGLDTGDTAVLDDDSLYGHSGANDCTTVTRDR